MSDPAVILDKVTLAIGRRPILEEISLAVTEGEFVGVLGANGAGKTTLFRAILGLHAVSAGTISVFGKPVNRGNPAIGYLPQGRSQLPTAALAGRDFLAASIAGNRPGLPLLTSGAARDIDRVLELTHGEALAQRPFSEMSGGERQRLLVAQALLGSPRMILFDEPLIGLDPHQQQVVVALVRELSRTLGLTVLFSAHELNQLLGAVDRVLYLGHRSAALGTVDEVIRPDVLSRLYDAPIEVLRAGGHIFVMSGGEDIEREHAHQHGHDHA